MIARLVARLEALCFGHRAAVLALLACITLVMGALATRLQMDAGFDKQLPSGHEYTDTFFQHRDTLFGANRLMVVVHARKGDIWNVAFLRKLNDVTKAVLYLPGVDRRTVSSLWTPNTRVLTITDEGFKARDVIGGDVTAERLTETQIGQIRDNVVTGGYIGSLVANDASGAMVVADLAGAYNDFGIRRWFERPRSQLDGKSPRQTLGAAWTPEDAAAARVRALAAVLSGPQPLAA